MKLKKPAQLQEVLDIARFLLSEVEAGSADRELEEKRGKLEQLKTVLEMYASKFFKNSIDLQLLTLSSL